MKKLFESLKTCVTDGEDSVLVTVLIATGSTPRSAGARMLVKEDGSITSTIGGGAIEHHIRNLAVEAIKEKRSYSDYFDVAKVGMVCGGDVEVHFQFVGGNNIESLKRIDLILGAYKENEDSWLISEMSEENFPLWGVYSKNKGLLGLTSEIEELASYCTTKPRLENIGGKKYYINPLVEAGRVCVFGGGHVAQELVPVLSHLGFRCLVFEDREAFMTEELFPEAEERVLGDTRNISAYINIKPSDYVVIMTRGHEHDFSVVAQALKAEPCYIGMIGSRNKIAVTSKRLVDEKGFVISDISKIHMPIGLPILAETPAEIAISIAGELIEVRAENRREKAKKEDEQKAER